MERILIIGASGNVGQAILEHFTPAKQQELFLATRKKSSPENNLLYFDFEDLEGSSYSLKRIDTLFLLRPPHISDVNAFFRPLVEKAKDHGVQHIVFLSVQGAESISFIPHAKIEKLIRESGIGYSFIRPSYFMQNLTTTLLQDIKVRNRIFLPAGKSKFLWMDVSDIEMAVAAILHDSKKHLNKAYTITGGELSNFEEVAGMLTKALGREISYLSPNLIRFFFTKRKEGVPIAYILVMIMLHYLPRFQKAPRPSSDLFILTGENPKTLREFIHKNKTI